MEAWSATYLTNYTYINKPVGGVRAKPGQRSKRVGALYTRTCLGLHWVTRGTARPRPQHIYVMEAVRKRHRERLGSSLRFLPRLPWPDWDDGEVRALQDEWEWLGEWWTLFPTHVVTTNVRDTCAKCGGLRGKSAEVKSVPRKYRDHAENASFLRLWTATSAPQFNAQKRMLVNFMQMQGWSRDTWRIVVQKNRMWFVFIQYKSHITIVVDTMVPPIRSSNNGQH